MEKARSSETGALLQYIGREVLVDFVWQGESHLERAKLHDVTSDTITVGNAVIPFKTGTAAIHRIIGEDGNALYQNHSIDDSYGSREESIEGLLRAEHSPKQTRKSGKSHKETGSPLQQYIDKEVFVDFVWCGMPHLKGAKLHDVTSEGITLDNATIPFKTETAAIRKISGEDGETIYLDPEIDDSYGGGKSMRELLRFEMEGKNPRVERTEIAVGNGFIFKVILVEDCSGGFVVEVPKLSGCHTQGEDVSDAVANIIETIECYIDLLRTQGKQVPIETLP